MDDRIKQLIEYEIKNDEDMNFLETKRTTITKTLEEL